ncbi:MAG: hypothetical protein O2840_01865 [bacterium]|nr:hypothetical protein [bacterium]
MHNSFQLDDFIGWVPFAKTLSLQKDLQHILVVGGTRVVVLLSFVLGYSLHGDWLPGYHLINMAAHAISSIGVFFLTRRLYLVLAKNNHSASHSTYFAVAAALLFATHPIQTQPVNYISQRLALFAGLFYIWSTYFYLLFRDTKIQMKRFIFGTIAGLLALLAFFSKENAFSLPVLWLMLETIQTTLDTKRSVQKIALWLTASFLVVFLIYIQRFGLDSVFSPKVTPLGETVAAYNYLLTQVEVIPKYLQLLVFPTDLSIDYYFPVVTTVFSIKFLLSLTTLLLTIYLALFFYKKDKVISFGIIWFFITLAVESSFIPIADVIFEHRVYLPSVGFVFVLAHLLSKLFSNTTKPWLMRTILLALILASYSFLTVQRNKVWSTQALIWQDVVNKFPLSPRAHYNLGFALAGEQDFPGATYHFGKTIELLPNHSKALNALGYLTIISGDHERAVQLLTAAVELEPENQLYRENLDIAMIEKLRAEK